MYKNANPKRKLHYLLFQYGNLKLTFTEVPGKMLLREGLV